MNGTVDLIIIRFMKTASFIILLFFILDSSSAQNLTGRYEGAVTRDGSVQFINFDFYIENGVQKGIYEIPEIGSYDVPINEIKIKNDTLNIKFYYGNFFCFLTDDKTQITGISEKWLPEIRLHLKKSDLKELPYIQEDITFFNKDINLSGMLYHPKQKSTERGTKYVILIHGSGEQDRYAPYYISLGYLLAQNGFGVLLYDKRGVGSSTGSFKKATIFDLADDALAAFNYLKNRNDLEVSEIGFLGTSQGGWIAPVAANNASGCDFLILNVGPAVSVYDQEIHRVKYSMKDDGWEQDEIDTAIAYTELYLRFANSNSQQDWKELIESGDKIKERDWAEYLNFPETENDLEWWKLNNFYPSEYLRNLGCRTLVIYAEKDVLVPPAENESLMRQYLTDAGIEFEIIVIDGTGHDMRTYQGLNGDNWDWPKVFWQWRMQPDMFINSIKQFLDKK